MIRFWSKVDKSGICWIWTGALDTGGYGLFRHEKKLFKAHRFAWFLSHRAHPNTLVCHSCDNPRCVRPEHLWLGTHSDNANDMVTKGRNQAIIDPRSVSNGTDHHWARLSTETVAAIREARNAGLTTRATAVLFGISPGYVSQLWSGDRRKWS